MIKSFFWLWLTAMVLITGGAMLVDLTVQQNYRQTANDPQIQLAEDLGNQLKNAVVSCNHFEPTDIATTQAPFVDVFDEQGNAVNFCLPGVQNLAAVGQINNHLPKLPAGVFAFAKSRGTAHFTWQPEPKLRFAAVVNYYHGENHGYVLAARSLEETEKRERALDQTVLLAWILGFVAASAGFGLAAWQSKKASI
ncbi:MAG TPA: hypothetical protein VLE93_00720 [Candidatus Saccharimonadales bacterium]|nr:hypothetical protein [Candidatus Saccharimonadales bacterium]